MLKKFENIWDREFGEVEFRMLKRIGKCGLCVSIMMGLTMIFLAGCGREKKIDYQIVGEDIEGISTDSDSGKSSVSQFAVETVWNENWTISGENGEEIEVVVEAEVLLPETDTMSVVEVIVPGFDAEWKEGIVKTIFGDEEVYYNDLEHLPKRELEKIYAEYEARSESDSEMERETAKQSMKKYAKLMETASDTYTPAETFESNDYIGKINGATYELGFYGIESVEGESNFIQKWILFHAVDEAELCPEKYKDYTKYMKHPYMTSDKYANIGENGCELSEAEAEQMAKSFLEESGLEYPVLIEVNPLLWGDDTMDYTNCYDWPANGYVFTYKYGIDGISFPDFESDFLVVGDDSYVSDASGYGRNAEANVYVTDRGIIGMYAYNPVETTEISENVKLLSLSSIREIMKEQIAVNYQEFNYDPNPRSAEAGRELLFTHLELVYFRVRDTQEPEYYSYIPVWRLGRYKVDSSGVVDRDNIRNPVLINAIDGSPIVWNE